MFPPAGLGGAEMQLRLARVFCQATACVDASLRVASTQLVNDEWKEERIAKVETAEAQDDASTSLTEHENFRFIR